MKKDDYLLILFLLIILMFMRSFGAAAAESGNVIQWEGKVYGSVSPLNFTVGYSDSLLMGKAYIVFG